MRKALRRPRVTGGVDFSPRAGASAVGMLAGFVLIVSGDSSCVVMGVSPLTALADPLPLPHSSGETQSCQVKRKKTGNIVALGTRHLFLGLYYFHRSCYSRSKAIPRLGERLAGISPVALSQMHLAGGGLNLYQCISAPSCSTRAC